MQRRWVGVAWTRQGFAVSCPQMLVMPRQRLHWGARTWVTTTTHEDSVQLGATLQSLMCTEKFARLLAHHTTGSDVLCLTGEMGTGKTAFTRCFVRSFFDDPTMQVTSPTYLLDLHYAAPTRPGITVRHLDLFRCTGPDDLRALGLVAPATSASRPPRISLPRSEIALIEWPQRVGMDFMPRDRLDLHFELLDKEDGEPNPHKSYKRTEANNNNRGEGNGDEDEDEDEDSEQRRVSLVGYGQWRARLLQIQDEWTQEQAAHH